MQPSIGPTVLRNLPSVFFGCEVLAAEGIEAYVAFLKGIGCPTRLAEVGIGDGLFEQYAKDAALVVRDKQGRLLGRPPLSTDDIVEILRSAL